MQAYSGAAGSLDSEIRAFRAEPLMMGMSSPGELILGEQLTDLHLHQLQQLGVVDLIALVQEHDDGGHAHLTGQQDVLTSLSHGAVEAAIPG